MVFEIIWVKDAKNAISPNIVNLCQAFYSVNNITVSYRITTNFLSIIHFLIWSYHATLAKHLNFMEVIAIGVVNFVELHVTLFIMQEFLI